MSHRLPGLGLAAVALLGLAAARPASAQSAIKLYNTGVNNDGTLAATGTTDLHYTQMSPLGHTSVFVNDKNGAYAGDPNSKYDAPDTSGGDSYRGGVYTVDYQTTFDLTGLDPSTAVIKGKWSMDDIGNDILINGHSTGLTSHVFTFTAFDLTPFQGDFQPGVNTLDFVWTNGGGPGGLDVAGLQETAAPAPAVPEASTTVSLGLLLALGLGGTVVAAKRKKARAGS